MKITEPKRETREPKLCGRCGGLGWMEAVVMDDQGTQHRASKPCQCLIARVVKARLGILRTVNMPQAPCLDSMTDRSLHLVGPWAIAGPQIKHAVVRRMWGLNPSWTCSVVTDADIRNAFFADRPNFARSKEPISLPDLMESPDLLVVRMGFLTMKNQDAPTMFLDALRSRSGPTWVVEDPAEPLVQCRTHSDRLDTLLESWTRVELGEEDR